MHRALDVGIDGRVVCHQPDVAVLRLARAWHEHKGATEKVVGVDVCRDPSKDLLLDELLHQLVGPVVHVEIERNEACI